MTIQIVYESDTGVKHTKAYVRVQQFIVDNGMDRTKTCSCNYSVFADIEARSNFKRPVFGPQGVTWTPEDGNKVTLTDAYLYLKSLPEFVAGQDV